MQPHKQQALTDFIEYPEQQMIQRAQSFYADLKRRHSIRKFSERSIPKSIIEDCIKTAGTAPSGANHQPWHFAAIESADVKRQVRQQAEAHEQRFYEGSASSEWLNALKPLGTDAQKPYLELAPWLIAVFSQKKGGPEQGQKQQNYYVHESVGIATGFLLAALHNAGLATLTHTPKPMSFLSEICQRPDDERAYMLIITGFPADDATIPEHALKKKSLSDIASFL
ncbi:nitroreductase family protein [Glaciecola siphonariae]|uniref:Nitroreductase family protein n=1 Tax=Glaciecola siphonariae TaxID=521012 RepID=A0ABV9M192_9ALTE